MPCGVFRWCAIYELFCAAATMPETFLHIDQKVFSRLSSFHGTGKMAYARLMLSEILPEVHHVIYAMQSEELFEL